MKHHPPMRIHKKVRTCFNLDYHVLAFVCVAGFRPGERGPFVSAKGPKTMLTVVWPFGSTTRFADSGGVQTRYAQTLHAFSRSSLHYSPTPPGQKIQNKVSSTERNLIIPTLIDMTMTDRSSIVFDACWLALEMDALIISRGLFERSELARPPSGVRSI